MVRPTHRSIASRTLANKQYMVPDREIIMRVKLASAGFAENADLARKFFILYQLCGEQLSKQIHYDFGLRNILSVLRTCGQQLRDGGKQKEGDVLKRVLIDMNRSKLVDSDIPLFESLVEDLFRQYQITPVDHGNLKPLIKQMTDKLGIFAHKPREPGVENKWHISCEQLYETSLVRHGIMILGPTMAGKSSTIYTLAKVLPEMSPEKKRLTVLKMNPKAITAPQMFGILNAQTGDWTDGIFSALWRRTCKKEGEFYWIVLNGPVDAVWIENLNTVLDDNKTLTLANSDRIPMSKTLKLVFEVDSLDNASPATVSRAGMIYMSGFSAYGWTLLFYAWIKEWPAEVKQLLTTMLDDSGLLNELYRLIDVKCRPVFNSPMLAIIRQFLMLLTAMIYDGSGIASKLDDDPNNKELLHEAINQGICFTNEGFCNAQQAQYQYIANIAGQLVGAMPQDQLKKCIFFCLMWSFGAILNLDDRHNLQKFFLEDDSAKAAQLDMPKLKNQNDFIYNYFVNDQGQWQQWVDVVPVYTYPPDRDPPFTSILIPTVDNTCLKYLITKFDKTTFNTLLTGEAGSGKTQNIFTYLGSKNTPDHDDYAINNINFSSATTMGILQQNVESFVEKRQGLIYGPPNGRKGIVFIDEINIPLINEWGDQPTNELTRQIIEERGLYALNKPGEFHQLQDLTFIGAMPLPGGGRNDIPARLKSQFSIINVNLPAADQLDTIFSTIVNGHFAQTRGFSDEVIQIAGRLVPLTRRLWTNTKIKMLPTPAKFHYIFNLRDLSRIVQGFIKNTPDEINNATVLMHQWANECYRVLPDKFTNTEDIAWFDNQIITLATEELGDTLSQEVQNYVQQGGENKYIYFADFMRDPPDEIPDDVDVNDIVPKVYEAVYDKTTMQERILMYQKKYNEDPINKNNTKLDLVLFDSCIQHILRISRIIRTPRAHALLVGVGGSGKQSCAKIASYIAGYKVDGLKIERNYGIPQLDEDLKRIYKLAGVSGQGVSFIFTDNDIKDEIFLERINNILTMGELPSLFNKEEKEEITQLVRNPFKKEFPRGSDTSEVLWDYFILRAKNNLHVILCFSPVGEKFRIRSRKFPGLISGCTIDWFLPWTRQALEDVANKMFQGFDIKVNSDQTIPNLVQHFGNVHSMMTDVTQKYFETYRRQTFVTPKSYLSFLATFKEMYIKKREELTQAYNRLNGGLQKLENAAQDVKEMSVQLEVEEKNLKVAQVEVAAKMGEIEIKRKEASKIAAEVQKVVDECSEKARVVKYNTDIAEEGKAKAEPEKQAAEEALNSIEQSAINNLVKLDNPPAVIQRIFDCVMILLNEKIEKVSFDEAVIAKGVCDNAIKPSWGIASKIGKQNGFFQRLIGFEKDAVTDEQCELIRAYIERQVDLRDKTAAERAFKAVVGLHSWCGCLVKYHYIMNDFIPIQNKVIELNKQLAIANQAKAVAEGELAEKQAALDALQRDFDIADGNRKALQDKADKTAARLTAASSLIKGLSGERKRWGEQLKEIDQSIINLVGDVSLCAAFLSYCGPFNQQFRDLLIHQIWMRDIEEKKLPHTKNINNNIIPFLTNDAVIGNWRIKGLPTDDQSTQNALIVTSSSRYPLLIDPQGQAGIWIKQMYPELKIVNQNHKMFRQIMEDCIEQGIPVLISDIEEELDPVLDPVLEKNYVTVGRGLQINFGNKNISFDPNFSLFITTKLPRPRYSPETYAKTSIIDFAVTFGGLEAQLLARTVNIERKELEEQRKQILQEVNDNRKKALDLEESLLAKLSASTGNLLDDDELIQVLQDTKKTTDEVNKQIAQAQQTEASINQTRENYMPVATRGSNIYFLITDMAMVSNMYQTSLKNFLELFDNSILEAPQSPIAQKRIESIKEYMTLKIFKYISRGLFEKDRVLFTLNLCLKIDMKDGKVTQQEFMCFIRAGAALDSVTKQKPAAFTQMDDQQWSNILALSQLQFFAQLPNQMTDNDTLWRDFFNDESPEQKQVPEYESLNSKEGRKENRFKRLLLIRCMRDDRAMLAVTDYINECLGTQYTDTYTPNFDDIVANECSNQQPICFLLSLGSDPTGQLEVIARKRKIELKNISMGQGQEPQARRLITESIANGGWVIINNSHLSIKFMGEIENMIDDIQERVRKVSGEEEEVVVQKEEKKKEEEPEEELTAEAAELKKQEEAAKKANEAEAAQAKLMGTGGIFSMLTPKQGPHADFRLILTTEPHPNFPIGLLQKCIKLTNDLPSGMRAGLKRTYTTLTQDTLDSVDKPLFWLPLVYSIAYIHSTVIERKKFGPLGWCTKYEFGQHDFNASVQFLQSYLYALDPKKADIASQISYPTIRYMISEVHYGGRVTDDFDRRLMKTYAHEWISEKVMQPGFYYSPQAKVTHPYAEVLKFLELPPSQNPQYFNINFVRDAINKMSTIDNPMIFRMHPNAEITYRKQETAGVLDILLNMQPKEGGGDKSGMTREEIVLNKAKQILSKAPEDYNMKTTVKRILDNMAINIHTGNGLPNPEKQPRPPLTVFLEQEIQRIQKVLSLVKSTLRNLDQAIAGTIIMTEDLQDALDCIYDARVPKKWLAISWDLNNLGLWLQDLSKRCGQYSEWLKYEKTGELSAFWLTGFFNPQGFLTSVKQKMARMSGWSLDNVTIVTTVMKQDVRGIEDLRNVQPAKKGAYVYGLFLEGAAWNKNKDILVDSPPKQLFSDLPVILFDAFDGTEQQQPTNTKNALKKYECPIYKTPFRTGLTYITKVYLPTDRDPNDWILKGCALLCQKD